MNNLQSAFFLDCTKAEKHADDIHRISPVLQLHVHPVEPVSLCSWVLLSSQFLEASATFFGLTSAKNTASCPFRCKPPSGKKPTFPGSGRRKRERFFAQDPGRNMMLKRCRSSFECHCIERMYYGPSQEGGKFALKHFFRGHLLDQQIIESFTICSLLQPIVLRDVLHVVRHGAKCRARLVLRPQCVHLQVSCTSDPARMSTDRPAAGSSLCRALISSPIHVRCLRTCGHPLRPMTAA